MEKKNKKNPQDRKEYNRTRIKVKKMIRKAWQKYEAEIAAKAKTDPKVVWSYIKSKTRFFQGKPDPYINNTKGDKLTKKTLKKLKYYQTSSQVFMSLKGVMMFYLK